MFFFLIFIVLLTVTILYFYSVIETRVDQILS